MSLKVKHFDKPNRAGILPTYTSQSAFVTDKGSAAVESEVIYNTTQHNIEIMTNGIARMPYLIQRVQLNNGTFNDNANQYTPVIVEWRIENIKDNGFTHSTSSSPGNITIVTSGWYLVTFKINVESYSGTRTTLQSAIYKNGTIIDETRTYSYMRNTTDDLLSCVLPSIELQLSSSDVLTVRVNREGSSGSTQILENECFIRIQKVMI